jgi:acetyl-CoA carboxylase carboxyl transferase alpha subunit
MRLAAVFGMPVITLIDTPGAYPGIDAEERGIGHAIASTLALMSDLPTPIISVIIGEGGSEGALALGVADRILMMENAIYSVISPEGAASIIYRDATKAEEMASALKLTALDCKELGVIDTVVPEPEGGAHANPDEAARLLRSAIVRELLEAQQFTPAKLIKNRYKKFRRMGEYSSYFRAAISKEVSDVQELIQRGVSMIRQRFSAAEKANDQLAKGQRD